MEHFAIAQEARIEKQYPRLLAQLKTASPQTTLQAVDVIISYCRKNHISLNQAIDEINVIYFTHLWREHRTIYKFDKTLTNTLGQQAGDTDDSERIPCELLQMLPYKCISVEMHPFAIQQRDIKTGGHGVRLEFTGNMYIYFEEKHYCTGENTLLVLCEMRDGKMIDYLLPIPENSTINDARETLQKYIAKMMPETEISEADVTLEMTPVLIAAQIVLYLQAQNADIQNAPPGPKRKRVKHGNGTKRQQNPTKIVYVGYRVGKLLRASAVSDNSEPSESGKKKRPHARRGHWHHYWVGPKNKPDERQLILRWVAPTMIHVGESNDITKVIKIK